MDASTHNAAQLGTRDTEDREPVSTKDYSIPVHHRSRLVIRICLVIVALLVSFWAVSIVRTIIFKTFLESGKRSEVYVAFLTTLIAAAIGAAVSAFIAYQFARMQAQDKSRNDALAYTAGLYDKFSLLYPERTAADEFLRQYPTENLHDLYQEHGIRSQAIWRIIDFYSLLLLAFKLGQVDEDLALGLFGQTFYWWYWVSFNPQLIDTLHPAVGEWVGTVHMQELKVYFDQRLMAKKKPRLRDDWNSKGQKVRAKRIEKVLKEPTPAV